MELAQIAHLTSAASVSAAMVACSYLGARTLAILTALYGSERLSRRAREVLRLLHHDRGQERSATLLNGSIRPESQRTE